MASSEPTNLELLEEIRRIRQTVNRLAEELYCNQRYQRRHYDCYDCYRRERHERENYEMRITGRWNSISPMLPYPKAC